MKLHLDSAVWQDKVALVSTAKNKRFVVGGPRGLNQRGRTCGGAAIVYLDDERLLCQVYCRLPCGMLATYARTDCHAPPLLSISTWSSPGCVIWHGYDSSTTTPSSSTTRRHWSFEETKQSQERTRRHLFSDEIFGA